MPIVSNSAEYQVEVLDRHATTYAPTTRLAWITNFRNLGWADYLNDVPEAFFTLSQDDPMVETLSPYMGKAHVRIYRRDQAANDTALVWAGWLGTELDERGQDVIIYAHGYLSSMWYLHTAWQTTWDTVSLNTIVSDSLTRAKTGIPESELNWITTGTIQAPATTSGGATPIILPLYEAYYKRLLFVMRDMSEIGKSDTTNAVVFEITPSGTFNFWGARGADRDVAYEYGTRDLADFRVLRTPFDRRNQVLAVGTSPRDLVLRTEQSAATSGWGRRQEALLLQWVRDQTELERVTKLRLAKANRDYLRLMLMFHPGAVIPPGHSFSPFILSDRVWIRIDKGTTNVNKRMLVSGIQVLFTNGNEHARLMVEDR